jgi:hypothetical protein
MKHNTEYQVAYKRGKLSNHLKKCYFDFVWILWYSSEFS